ncbi:MAG: L,D-transpeptidase family protein [Lacibacter sp.]
MTKLFKAGLCITVPTGFLLLIFLLQSCKEGKNQPANLIHDVDVTIQQQMEPASATNFDSAFASAFFKKFPLLHSIEKNWMSFYRERNYSFAWVDADGITVAAQNLHNRINNLTDDGLNKSLVYRTEFNQLYDDASFLKGKNILKDTTLIYAEMMLSAQYFLYAQKIYGSFTERELKELGWNIKPKKVSYDEYLNSVLRDERKDIFDHEPVFVQYGLLKRFLLQYRGIDSAGGWPLIDGKIKKLLPGDTSKKIIAIKKRLAASNNFSKTDTGNLFNPALAAVVKQVRKNYGLKDTALIDMSLITELNVPVKKRIEQILVNMQRCRWMPYNPGPEYIAVNIPDYRMYVYENGKLNFSMSVVVGQEVTKTVIFNDTLTTVAFSPYWNVPYSIYKNELSQKSSSYLNRNNFEYTAPGKLRQKPGKSNALGQVKFLFPNSYNIYFHDTPAKDKFRYSQRAFSHGCIRLNEAKKLALHLFRNDKNYPEKKIDSLMRLDKEVQIRLKRTVPVFITYLTAFADTQTGELQFRKDIYHHDEAVLSKMISQ